MENDRARVLEVKWAPVREKASRVLDGLDAGSLIEIPVDPAEMGDGDEEGEAGMYEE